MRCLIWKSLVTSFSRIPRRDEFLPIKVTGFYVDQIIKEKDSQVEHMQELMIQRVDRVELLLKQLAKVLANNTNYATLISGPSYNQTKLKVYPALEGGGTQTSGGSRCGRKYYKKLLCYDR